MKKLLTGTLILLLLIASCGKKEVKKQSEDSKLAMQAFEVVEAIREAYVNKSLRTLESNTTKEGYRTMLSSMKDFDSVEMNFNPVLMEIEGDDVSINISWRGKWHKGEKISEERGMGVFLLKGKPLKLDNILRGNPFIYPK
ncbi:MAG: hypothetical protein ACLPX5_15220 [Dissulfurispiraceae bacterium]